MGSGRQHIFCPRPMLLAFFVERFGSGRSATKLRSAAVSKNSASLALTYSPNVLRPLNLAKSQRSFSTTFQCGAENQTETAFLESPREPRDEQSEATRLLMFLVWPIFNRP